MPLMKILSSRLIRPWTKLGRKKHLKILEDGRDKLVDIAEAVHAGMVDKLDDKLAEINEEILSNKGVSRVWLRNS